MGAEVRKKDNQIKGMTEKALANSLKGSKLISPIEINGNLTRQISYRDEDIKELKNGIKETWKYLEQENSSLRRLVCYIQDSLSSELEKRKSLIQKIDSTRSANVRGGLSLADIKSNLLNLTFKDYQDIGIPAIQDNIRQLFNAFEQIDSYRLNC